MIKRHKPNAEVLFEAIKNPPAPNEQLIKAAQTYKETGISKDSR